MQKDELCFSPQLNVEVRICIGRTLFIYKFGTAEKVQLQTNMKVVELKLRTAEKIAIADMRTCSFWPTFLEKVTNTGMQLQKCFPKVADQKQ